MIKKLFTIVICFIAYSAFYTNAFAEIVILKSKDLVLPYELASEGFKSVVKDDFVEFDMESSSSKGRKVIKKVKKLIKSKNPPSAIFTIGKLASELAGKEISTVPVIFCMVVNPERADFNGNNNVGGVSFDVSIRPQLTRMTQIVSYAENIGVIYDPKKSSNIIKEAEEIAEDLGLNLIGIKVKSSKDVPDALDKLIKKIDLLWVYPDSTVLSQKSFEHINLTALRNCIPVMSCSPQLVELGSPFSFYSDAFSVGAQAGAICNKAIKGAFKDAIPIENPQEIFLALNLITLKRCGIKLPQKILDSARHIYK